MNKLVDVNFSFYWLNLHRWAFKEAIVKATGKRELIFPNMYLIKDIDTLKPILKLEEPNK